MPRKTSGLTQKGVARTLLFIIWKSTGNDMLGSVLLFGCISYPTVYRIFAFREFESRRKEKTAIFYLCFGTEKIADWIAKKSDTIGLFCRRRLY